MELHGVPEEVLGAAVDDHINDPTDAHQASAIGVTPFGDIEATDVQSALEEIASELSDDRWEDIGDPPVAIGTTRPLVLNDHPLYLREPIGGDVPDLNHSIEWGYDRHEIDGALITGYTEVGVSVGDANEAEDELVGRFGQFWSWLKGRLLIAVDPGDDDGSYEVQIGGESSLRVEGGLKFEDLAAPENETYVLLIDEEGVVSSDEAPEGGGGGVEVKDAGATIGTRPAINFHEGANVTLTIVDDPGDDEVDVTIAASGGGGGGGAGDKLAKFVFCR